jgi:hypothetical protein
LLETQYSPISTSNQAPSGPSAIICDIVAGEDIAMNVQQIDRERLLAHLKAIEEKFPLRFVGLLPTGIAGHVSGEDAVEFLAEKREGLSLLGLAGAEMDLSERLDRPVAIVLDSELHGDFRERALAGVRPF